MSDGTLLNDFSAQAQSVTLNGDNTAAMAVVKDTTTTTTTTPPTKRK
jgi:hypothetical protein